MFLYIILDFFFRRGGGGIMLLTSIVRISKLKRLSLNPFNLLPHTPLPQFLLIFRTLRLKAVKLKTPCKPGKKGKPLPITKQSKR